ncbi:MAG: peptidylprolyl isomerase, partial [Thiohalobacteraceae bacterium]
KNTPDFQRDGEFSQDLYQSLLAQQRLTPQEFEEDFRRALLINQLIAGVSGSAAVAPQAVEQGLRLQGQERELRYARLPMTRYTDSVDITPEQVAAFYDANKARFMEPEQVRLQYLELSLDVIAADLEATDAEIEQLYASEKDRLAGDEQRRARHILIQLDESAGDEDVMAARREAEDLVARLRAGEDFASLAKAHSDDPGSAAEGGDLGLFGRGMMVPEFEEAAFAMAEGEISEPVRSPFGFHVIQVTETKAAQVPSLEELRPQLAEQVVRDEAEQLFLERAELLGARTFEHPDTLTVAAEELGLKVQESDWLPPSGGEGIGSYPQVMEAALSEDVLNDGNNSGIIEVEPNHVFVVRALEHKPAQQVPLDAVRDAIERSLRQQEAAKAARDQGTASLARLRAGASIEEVAAELDLEVEDAGFIARNESKQPREIVAQAFRVPRVGAGQPAYAGGTLANGDFVLLQVDSVRDGDLDAIGAEAREAFRDNLGQLYGSMETTALLEQLKSDAEIERNLERLD